METKASYLLVGTFVLLVIAAIFGFMIWIAKGQIDKTTVKYQTYFSTTVTGLQKGSPVRYRGIPAGEVTDIKVAATDPNLVEVTFEVDANKKNLRIHRFSTAVLETQGITGVAFIQIKHNEEKLKAWRQRVGKSHGIPGPPQINRNLGAEYPTLQSEGSGFEKILTALPEMLKSIKELSESAKLLFDEDNRRSIKTMLASLSSLTKRLDDRGEDIDKMIIGLRKTAKELPDAIVDIKAGMTQFGNMSNEMRQMVSENRRPFRDFASTGLYELSRFIAEARLLVNNLNRVTKNFEEDPSRFLFGNSQKGYQPQ